MSTNVNGIISWLRTFLDDVYALKGSGGGITLDDVYPIGSIYMSISSTNPATLFGGSWTRIKDTFLLASGDTYSSDGDVDTAQHGSATVKLTINEIPSHHHQTGDRQTYNGSGNAHALIGYGTSVSTSNVNTSNVGGGQAHNNMPPYMAVYVWKRTS